ncbi:DUF3530 family protein [Marinomonas epiphytica]
MKKKTLTKLFSFPLLALFCNLAWAQDNQERVQPTPQKARIAALVSSLEKRGLGHQIKSLEAEGAEFLSLFIPSRTLSSQGCLLLLSSDNEHPDWPDTIAPVRNALPNYSWCTLSIELPDITPRGEAMPPVIASIPPDELPPLANQELAFSRIQSAINFMAEQNVSNLALLGSKTGASYALAFMSNAPRNIQSLILVDSETPNGVNTYQLAQTISKINAPILDLYPNTKRVQSDQFALWREQAANQRQPQKWQYIALQSAQEGSFAQDPQALVQRVRGFLKQNTSQISQRHNLPTFSKGLFY